jgi:hypothetical protein
MLQEPIETGGHVPRDATSGTTSWEGSDTIQPSRSPLHLRVLFRLQLLPVHRLRALHTVAHACRPQFRAAAETAVAYASAVHCRVPRAPLMLLRAESEEGVPGCEGGWGHGRGQARGHPQLGGACPTECPAPHLPALLCSCKSSGTRDACGRQATRRAATLSRVTTLASASGSTHHNQRTINQRTAVQRTAVRCTAILTEGTHAAGPPRGAADSAYVVDSAPRR